MVEAVKATITFKTSNPFSVRVLDHDGLLTERKVAVSQNAFKLDGTITKTIWYEIHVKSGKIIEWFIYIIGNRSF